MRTPWSAASEEHAHCKDGGSVQELLQPSSHGEGCSQSALALPSDTPQSRGHLMPSSVPLRLAVLAQA